MAVYFYSSTCILTRRKNIQPYSTSNCLIRYIYWQIISILCEFSGRGMKSGDNFQMLYDLADKFNAAGWWISCIHVQCSMSQTQIQDYFQGVHHFKEGVVCALSFNYEKSRIIVKNIWEKIDFIRGSSHESLFGIIYSRVRGTWSSFYHCVDHAVTYWFIFNLVFKEILHTKDY